MCVLGVCEVRYTMCMYVYVVHTWEIHMCSLVNEYPAMKKLLLQL